MGDLGGFHFLYSPPSPPKSGDSEIAQMNSFLEEITFATEQLGEQHLYSRLVVLRFVQWSFPTSAAPGLDCQHFSFSLLSPFFTAFCFGISINSSFL
jgi:hypothetical protein